MTRRPIPDGEPGPVATDKHVPVLLSEVLAALAPAAGETYIDGTLGAGGYTRAILDAADCRVLAIDRDLKAVRDAQPLIEAYKPRLAVVHDRFSRLDAIAADVFAADASSPQPAIADGVVLDIGVSSMQLDEANRGFSFQHDGPLDMRMGDDGPTAADFINTAEESEIADVIYRYGEDHKSRAIARAIVRRRAETPFSRTLELADVVWRVLHGRRVDGRHPATRTFQALRVHVNDELGELERALGAAERVLKPGGRLVVVTFHSLEDRIVKKFLIEQAGRTPRGSRYLPELIKVSEPRFQILNLRPLTPQKGELDVNPRARSARLRAAIRTDAAAQN